MSHTAKDTTEQEAAPDECPMTVRAFTGADFEPLSRLLGVARHAKHGAQSYWQGSDELCAHLANSDAGFVAVDEEGNVQGVALVKSPREQDHNSSMRMHWLQQRTRIAAMANALGIQARADVAQLQDDAKNDDSGAVVLLELSPPAREAHADAALLCHAQKWLREHE